jgi:cysteine synthase A
VIDEIVTVNDAAAEKMARRCAREEGILVGPSSGANIVAACEVARRVKGLVVTILCDSGERYFASG